MDLDKKKMYRKMEEDMEIMLQKDKIIAELHVEKELAIKRISELKD